MSIVDLSKKNYSKCQKWNDFFNEGKSLSDIHYDLTWSIMFAKIKKDSRFQRTNDKLKKAVAKDKHLKIYPLPKYVFRAFTATPIDGLKVVFIGQDPYFNCEYYQGSYAPQAMGLSFSVAHGIQIPSSLDNIYKNMMNFGHIKKYPQTGNLWFWAHQGCLMFNASLTVEHDSKKSHTDHWEWCTNDIIRYISQYMENIIFVMWGGDAYRKIDLINLNKHHAIISSHPSGLSANKPFRKYPPFMQQDHFGKINQYLIKHNKTPILWD